VSGGGLLRAECPHVLRPVAELHTGGQLTAQEAQRGQTEDPAGETYKIRMMFEVCCLTLSVTLTFAELW